jgi:hypothetical protein
MADFQSTLESEVYQVTEGRGIAAAWCWVVIVTICSTNHWGCQSLAELEDMRSLSNFAWVIKIVPYLGRSISPPAQSLVKDVTQWCICCLEGLHPQVPLFHN